MRTYNLLLLPILMAFTTACSNTGLSTSTSSAMDKVVPYLAKSNTSIQPDGVSWANSKAFHSVPGQLQAKGNQVCQRYNFDAAVGYHPEAKDLKGNLIPGGGYLCGKVAS